MSIVLQDNFVISSIGGDSHGKYKALKRFKDDNNNEIGTVSGYFKDSEGKEYAVVCLDATYRASQKEWLSTRTQIPGIELMNDWEKCYSNTDTATENGDKVLDFCDESGYTSEAFEHCRSFSFTIGGQTYYGQLPNRKELTDICYNMAEINALDPTVEDNPDLALPPTDAYIWTSSVYNNTNVWAFSNAPAIVGYGMNQKSFVVTILEIPNK